MTFLVTAAANLSDLSNGVGWREVASLLSGVDVASCLPFSSHTWRKMCDWVTAVSAVCEEPISSFLASSLVSLLDPEGRGVGPGHSSLSLLSLLAVDAQLISRSSLEELLEPVTTVVSSASSRPYLSPHTLTLSLLTLNSFLTTFLSGSILSPDLWQGGQSDTGRLVYDTLLPWLPDMVGTVEGLLLRGTLGEGLSLPHLTVLTSSLSSLHTFTSLYGFSWSGDISPAHMMSTALRNLHSALSSNDQELELTCGAVGSLGAVGWVCARNTDLPRSTLSSLLSLPPHLSFHKPSVAPCSESSGCGGMEWGPLVEWCEAQTWTATHYCLRHQSRREAGNVRSDDGCRWEICDIWELCAERVECVTGRQLPTLLDCLCLALPFIEVSNISSTVTDCCWRIVKDSLSYLLPSFLSLLLHPHILFSSDPILVDLVGKLCSEVLELGERRAGLTNVLASALCASWRGEWERGGEERVVQSLLRHRQLILELCCFGGVGIRSMRSQENGEEFVRLLGDQVAANSAANSRLHGDCGVRLTILSFLVGVASRQGSSHFFSQFSSDVMEKVGMSKSSWCYGCSPTAV
jgi:hypothetical protein